MCGKYGVLIQKWVYISDGTIFCEGSILMKCSILYGGLRGSIQFLSFETFYMVFVWGQK